MNVDRVARLARTLLYEGYLLYPYRTSSVKNQHRWMFGTLYPRRFVEEQDEADRWWTRTECLVRGGDRTVIEARARFLHLAGSGTVEREVTAPSRSLGHLVDAPDTTAFTFGSDAGEEELCGALDISARHAGAGLYAVTAQVRNLTPLDDLPSDEREHRRDTALRCAFASTHTLLGVSGGEFVSLVDPPADVGEAAAGCQSVGTWPILVGEPGARDTILSTPLILADYPQLAPESAGDFFDATEIDELLTLRILTLTDAEKQAMQTGDARAQALLERTEAQSDQQRRRLHGAPRTPSVTARAPSFEAGVRVRLRPRPGGDIFDIALAGRTATVVKTEEDYDGRILVAVTIDDDPGRDLGVDGRPGHRFFFRPEEVEVLP